MTDEKKLFDSFSTLQVLVVGDVMIDAYSWGSIERMSPEAPVPIVDIEKKEYRLGGAANVAKNIIAMGAQCSLCSVVGNDESGKIFLEMLEFDNLSKEGVQVSEDRKTTVKHRVFDDAKQVLRIDEEDSHNLNLHEQQILLSEIERRIETVDVVILQDYDKGVLNKNNIHEIVALAKKQSVPVVVDPKIENFKEYKNVDLFKPNRKELCVGLGIKDSALSDEEVKKAVTNLKQQMNIKNVLVTLADKGLYVDFGDTQKHIETKTSSVADVCGAGDAVIAIVSLLHVLETPPIQIGELANRAGGQVCGSLGVVSVDIEALSSNVD